LPTSLPLTHAQFPYLTYVVFQYYNAPEQNYHYLSYDAALILVVIVLLLLVASRIVVARTQRHTEGARTRVRTPRRPRRPTGTMDGLDIAGMAGRR
jgi:ABC-type Fe3+ transport system permease subunit